MTNYRDIYSGRVVFYDCDLRYLSDVSEDLSQTFAQLANPWWRMSSKDIEVILTVAVRLSFYLNNRGLFYYLGRPVPKTELLEALKSHLVVPRFVRDIAREYNRCMEHAGSYYLPDLFFDVSAKPAAIDLLGKISDKLTKWIQCCRKIGYEMVEINEESTMNAPLAFFDMENSDAIFVWEPPEWRKECFQRTRHLLYDPRLPCVGNVSANGEEKKIRRKEVNPPEFEDDREIYNKFVKDKRFIDGVPCWFYRMEFHQDRMGVIHPQFRFPTFEEHSRTPPHSSRSLGKRSKAHPSDRGGGAEESDRPSAGNH